MEYKRIKLKNAEDYVFLDPEVFEHLEKNGLKNKTQNHGFLPHCEMTTLLSTKAILLLSQNRTDNVMGIIPGKLFEYLASKRPILTIGHPDGDCNQILKKTGAFSAIDFDDADKMKTRVLELYQHFKNGTLTNRQYQVNQFDRKELTRQMCEHLNQLIV